MFREICSSECRTGIVRQLLGGERGSRELSDELGFDGSTVRRNLKKLREGGWVERRDGVYTLVRGRRFLLEALCETDSLFDIYMENREFWDRHGIEGIPEGLRRRLHELEGGEILRSGPEDIFDPYDEFYENLEESDEVFGVSPIFHPDYPEFFSDLADRGKEVQLVLTPKVLERSLQSPPGPDRFLDSETAEIYLHRGDPEVAFTVTDRFLSLGLFEESGGYDPSRDFICHAESALEWGRDLFEHFREEAERLEPGAAEELTQL